MWREALLIALAVSARGCTCGGTAKGFPAARVQVFDAATGAPICDATVTLDTPHDHELLSPDFDQEAGAPHEAGAACSYIGGLGVDTDHFTLTVSAPGYVTQQKQAAKAPLTCGGNPTREVTFTLQPQ